MHVTKRSLGEGFLTGTGTVLAGIVLGTLIVDGVGFGAWVLLGLVPITGLGAVVYWLQSLDLDDQQIWYVAECSAVGMGSVMVLLLGLHLSRQFLTVSTRLTIALSAVAGTATVAGTLVGVTTQLRRSKRRLSLRNAVLYRVLRHNLRNDMTVVLGHLEEIKETADDPNRERVEAAEQKIDDLIELSDKVRRTGVAPDGNSDRRRTIDLVELIHRRVEMVIEMYPDLAITTSFPDYAPTYVEGQFALVVDNIVESAHTAGGTPALHVEIRVSRDTVVLAIEDRGQTLPDTDLAAVATGAENDLEHACGMELWLIYWLVERNDGDLTIDPGADPSRIEIRLDRVFDGNTLL